METNIAVFKGKEIRKTIYNNEWWFSIVDVCSVLTESADAGAYWRKLKQRLREEGSEVVTLCYGLKLLAPDGKLRETDCANTEGKKRDRFIFFQTYPPPLPISWITP
jgi:prophage antirepressor-like protein